MRLGNIQIIIFALLAILIVASIWFGETSPWAQCKESLLQQLFSDQCTPVSGIAGPESEKTIIPESDGFNT